MVILLTSKKMADQHPLYSTLHNRHASYAHTYALDQSTNPPKVQFSKYKDKPNDKQELNIYKKIQIIEFYL